jgi:hypothetical protein
MGENVRENYKRKKEYRKGKERKGKCLKNILQISPFF